MGQSKPKSRSKRSAEEKAERAWLKPYRFGPNNNANPSGRPKKKPVSDRYLHAWETSLPDDICRKLNLSRGSCVGDAIARAVTMQALVGPSRVEAAREIREAIEGKAPPAIAIKHSGGVRLSVVYREGRIGGLGDDDFGTTD